MRGPEAHTGGMTLTQLGAFVLVARLGSVKEAARALNVSEPAVSQALAALRRHLGDPLIVPGRGGMTLTEGGARLLPIASQMVVLGAEAEGAVRAARGAPEALRVVAVPAIAEFVATPLLEAFGARSSARSRAARAWSAGGRWRSCCTTGSRTWPSARVSPATGGSSASR